MKRRGQSAIEYLFMLAAALVLVLFVARIVLRSVRVITNSINNYVTDVRKQVLENL